jgi:hypothetical protein
MEIAGHQDRVLLNAVVTIVKSIAQSSSVQNCTANTQSKGGGNVAQNVLPMKVKNDFWVQIEKM